MHVHVDLKCFEINSDVKKLNKTAFEISISCPNDSKSPQRPKLFISFLRSLSPLHVLFSKKCRRSRYICIAFHLFSLFHRNFGRIETWSTPPACISSSNLVCLFWRAASMTFNSVLPVSSAPFGY
jgi:hypothetical protein